MSQRSARLNALAAALCALLLLVALGILDANRAPWWALVATQGALLVTTASAGIWLDRADGGRRTAFGRGRDEPPLPWWAQADARAQDGWSPQMWQRHGLPGVLRSGDGGPRSTEQAFWIERGQGRVDEEER